MIPKIIHFCWLSGDKYPSKISYCISTWNKIIPDYKFVLWDWNKCKEENILNDWVKEAFLKKKYAFAADFVRLYAVYKYGGIYLDSDVEVIKRFDELLQLPYFIGKEAIGNRLEIAAFGAEKNCEWIKHVLDYYDGRHFVNPDGSLDMKVMPDIIYETINKNYTFANVSTIKDFVHDKSTFNVFPSHWFCAHVCLNGADKPSFIISKETFCVHHFANSWLKRNRIKKILLHIINSIYSLIDKLKKLK